MKNKTKIIKLNNKPITPDIINNSSLEFSKYRNIIQQMNDRQTNQVMFVKNLTLNKRFTKNINTYYKNSNNRYTKIINNNITKSDGLILYTLKLIGKGIVILIMLVLEVFMFVGWLIVTSIIELFFIFKWLIGSLFKKKEIPFKRFEE